jgi:hypothetical protein
MEGKDSDFMSTVNKINAYNTRIKEGVKSAQELNETLEGLANKISSSSPAFLQNHKAGLLEASDELGKVFKKITSVSKTVGVVMDLFEAFSGKDPESSTSTTPEATTYELSLQGTMDIQEVLNGTTIKIPGVQLPTGQQNPPIYYYDCPMGVFNLKSTPVIQSTTSYERTACPGISGYYIYQVPQPVYSGYSGYYRKYKLNSDIQVAVNNVPGMTLTDIKFAIVCRPSGYNITDQIITVNTFYNSLGQATNIPLANPVYNDLQSGRLIVHKFDQDNNTVIFGSPYLDKNCIKGYTLEVPENTNVQLAVIAVFNGTTDPVIFKATYNFDVQEVSPADSRRCGSNEQSTFPYSSYFTGSLSPVSLSNHPNSSPYIAPYITMTPGFQGTPGFSAIPQGYPTICVGNTGINYSAEPSSCGNSQGQRVAQLDVLDKPVESVSIYPNPTLGKFNLNFNYDKDKSIEVNVFNAMGREIYSSNLGSIGIGQVEIDLSSEAVGMYMVKIKSNNDITYEKVILNK